MAATVAPRGGSITVRRNPAAPWRHLDIALFVSTVALAGIGLLMVYSATLHKQKAAGLDPQAFLKKHDKDWGRPSKVELTKGEFFPGMKGDGVYSVTYPTPEDEVKILGERVVIVDTKSGRVEFLPRK